MKNLASKEAFEKAELKPGAILVQNVCSFPRPYIFMGLRDKYFIVQSVLCDVERLERYGTELLHRRVCERRT